LALLEEVHQLQRAGVLHGFQVAAHLGIDLVGLVAAPTQGFAGTEQTALDGAHFGGHILLRVDAVPARR
jgi:hypothetical protein